MSEDLTQEVDTLSSQLDWKALRAAAASHTTPTASHTTRYGANASGPLPLVRQAKGQCSMLLLVVTVLASGRLTEVPPNSNCLPIFFYINFF